MTWETKEDSSAQSISHNYKQVFLALLNFCSPASWRVPILTSIDSTMASPRLQQAWFGALPFSQPAFTKFAHDGSSGNTNDIPVSAEGLHCISPRHKIRVTTLPPHYRVNSITWWGHVHTAGNSRGGQTSPEIHEQMRGKLYKEQHAKESCLKLRKNGFLRWQWLSLKWLQRN